MLARELGWTNREVVDGPLARLLYAATRVPTIASIAWAVSAIVLLALAEIATGPAWSLEVFYYLPIAFAAWRLGGVLGLCAAFLSALAAFTTAMQMGVLPTEPLPAAWSFLSRTISFGVGALLAAEMRRLFERERGLAERDFLTGALLGRAFRDVLDREVVRARRSTASLTLVYIDMDDFKALNDAHGHAVGDEVLRAFAGTVTDHLNACDEFARVGGDEFVVLMPGRDGRERVAVEALQRALHATLGESGHGVTCSIGAMIVPAGASLDAGELVRRADAAMYEAKRGGKGRICTFTLGERSSLSVAA